MVGRGRSSVRPIVGAVWLVSAALAGCSSDDGATGDASAPAEPAASSGVATVTPTTTAATATTPAAATATANETIATVPEQAVPGIDSEDPFCRSWSEFAGSFQALAFASTDGTDPLVGARLEVVAAGAVVAAAQSLDDAFPDEIADEREMFVDDVIGPFARRAARAVAELRSVGVGEDDIELLGDAWLAALATADATDPAIIVDVPAELDAAVDAAVDVASAAIAVDLPPIADDPSLITRAEAPGTLGYLAEQCPDQGVLAGNDAID